MKRRLLAFFAIAVFVLIPFLFFWQDRDYGRYLEWEAQCEDARREARERLQQVICSTSSDFQTRNLLRSWHGDLAVNMHQSHGVIASAAERSYRERIRNLLPPHHLFVAMETATGSFSLLFQNSAGLEFPEKLTWGILLGLIDEGERRKVSLFFNTRAREFFQFPLTERYLFLAGVGLGEESDAIFQVLNTLDRAHALFWHHSSRVDFPRLVVVCVMDWGRSDEEMGLRDLIFLENDQQGLAFMPRQKSGQSMHSSFFASRPRLTEYVRKWTRVQGGSFHEIIWEDFFLCQSSLLSNLPYTALLVKPLPRRGDIPVSGVEKAGFFLSLAFVILLLKTAAEKTLMNRGPRVSIALALLGSFLLTSLIPIAGGKLLIGIGLHEQLIRQRQKAELALQRVLQSIDSSYQIVQAEIGEGIKTHSSDPALPVRIETAIGGDSLYELLDDMSFFGGYHYPKTHKHRVKALNIVGPHDFARGYAGDSGEGAGEKESLSRGFAPITRKLLRRWNPDLEKPPGQPFAADEKLSLKEVESEITEDFFGEFFAGLFGRNSAYRLMNDRNFISLSRQSFATIYQITTFFGKELAPRFLGVWVYDDMMPQTRFVSCFEDLPSYLGDVFTFMGTRREEHKVDYPVGIRAFPPVFRTLFDQARILGMPQTSVGTVGTETFLLSVMPGQHLKKMSIGGAYSLRKIMADERFKAGLFQVLVLLALMTAAIIAFQMFRYFMTPLRDLIEKISLIKQQRYEVRLDSSRRDEFGSVASAFNMMASGLEEGRILGQFVSPAVRKVIQDRDRYARALKGEAREMTILFSTLKGFSEFLSRHETAELYRELGRHLSSFSEAIRNHGGEIDKVIGEKVMVFFDHQELGGREKAVAAALSVIREVRAALKDAPLTPVMGLNSGNVISGILGARTVRMDYTVIGDTVNLAARLGAMAYTCGGSGIVFSGETRRLLASQVKVERLSQTQVKGKLKAVEAFLLVE